MRNRFEIVERDGRHVVVDKRFPEGNPNRERAEFTRFNLAKAWIAREKILLAKLAKQRTESDDPCPT